MQRKLAVVISMIAITLVLLTHAAVPGTGATQVESELVILAADWIRVEPEAETWPLVVTIFSTKQVLDVKLQVKVDGRNITSTVKQCPEGVLPVNLVSGISTGALRRFVSVARQQQVEEIPAVDLREFNRLHSLVSRQVGRVRSLLIEIPVQRLPLKPEEGKTYSIMLWADSSEGADAVETRVLAAGLPKSTVWLPAELHAHSTVSDNLRFSVEQVAQVYSNLGYQALYMTDHLDGVVEYGWANYLKDVAKSSQRHQICVMPGVEITTAYAKPDDDDHDEPDGQDDDDDQDNDADDDDGEAIFSGDLLAYGMQNLDGLRQMPIAPERAIQTVLHNNPGFSSSAIAHPCRPGWGWGNWTVSGYSGIELMSGWQFAIGPASKPFKRWINDVYRQLPDAFASGCFPAARAGGDWHGWLNPRSYVTWVDIGGSTSPETINQALRQGRTTASRFGGLATLAIIAGDGSYRVGDIVQGILPGTKLKMEMTLQAVVQGEYQLALYQSGLEQPLHQFELDAADDGKAAKAVEVSFPGGQQCYYLVVSGADFICTSPIFIGQ